MTLWRLSDRSSLPRSIVFWWGVLFVIQQAHRLFLLPDAVVVEQVDMPILLQTLLTGLRADLTVSSLGVLVGLLLATSCWMAARLGVLAMGNRVPDGLFARIFSRIIIGLACLYFAFLVVDMGYYSYNRDHPDLVFFEYLEDFFSGRDENTGPVDIPSNSSQARRQTEAELNQMEKWAPKLIGFAVLQITVLTGWAYLFRRTVAPFIARKEGIQPRGVAVGAVVAVLIGFSGFHPMGPWSIARADISSSSYYLLAQNPIWYTGDVLYGSFSTRLGKAASRVTQLMELQEAIDVTRRTLVHGQVFVSDDYPLVRNGVPGSIRLQRPPNIVVLFIEGLDRRFLGKAVRPEPPVAPGFSVTELYREGLGRLLPAGTPGAIAITPFLDKLAKDSIYFENFFSPGDKTHHGLFSSLCSFYSGYGRSPIKSRYTYDYQCLPAMLNRAGYETEMVIGYNRDYHQDHTALFLGRNGLRRFFDESRFPAQAERVGLGMSDGALFDFLSARIRSLRTSDRPFFLTTLTLNTHHPYDVPEQHPDVVSLRTDADPYLAPLRYVDVELERWFGALSREGLLENTVVLILGDHGRHERVGRGGGQHFVGHHTTPLFLWLDHSIRTQSSYRPRTVSTVASQVDLAPTMLALAGLTPRLTAFVGRDLSCLISGDCAADNRALLCGIQQIGLADQNGIALYSIVQETVQTGPLALDEQFAERAPVDNRVGEQLRTMKALLVTAHVLLERNRIWSWAQFEKDL